MNIACFESNHRMHIFLICVIVLHYLLYLEAIKTFFILSLSYLILKLQIDNSNGKSGGGKRGWRNHSTQRGLMSNCFPLIPNGSYQSLEQSSANKLPTWAITGAMANRKAKKIIAGSLPLQAWKQLWLAPALEARIYTLAPLLQAGKNH